jgi:hypothetical protein
MPDQPTARPCQIWAHTTTGRRIRILTATGDRVTYGAPPAPPDTPPHSGHAS